MGQHYKRYSDDERMRLIMECRQSGLSDYQWCCENNVSNSTFYNWVKKLRDVACNVELIESAPINKTNSAKQDIVRVNVLPEHEPTSVIESNRNSMDKDEATIELNLNGCIIKIHNNANPVLLAHTINLLRGVI